MWEYISERPSRLNAFNDFMEGQRVGRTQWYRGFPVEESLSDESNDLDTVLMVDVGGGRGHDLEAFKAAFPQLPGKAIVQDLPFTIDDIKHLAPEVEAMKHNFFDPQPVKGRNPGHFLVYVGADRCRVGAKSYYFRNIFHDCKSPYLGISIRPCN